LKKFSTWDPELTEKPVTNTIPDERTARDSSSRKEGKSEIQAPESPTQL
jgi:cell division protease FtsH